MSERRSIEVTAETVDEAIANGLKELSAAPGDVIVEVLEEPNRGVFGIGARPAKVRLQLLRVAAPPPPPPAPVQTQPTPREGSESRREEPHEGRRENRRDGERDRNHDRSSRSGQQGNRSDTRSSRGGDRSREGRGQGQGQGRGGYGDRQRSSSRPPRQTERRSAPPPPIDDDFSDEDDLIAFAGEMVGLEGEAAEEAQIAHTVLMEILRQMSVRGIEIKVSRAEASEPGETTPLLLNVEGEDLDYLIGRRGEALSALQYVTRLIASRRLQRRANIVVDIAGYKLRRAQRLRELAIRMANQAIEQARIIYLEPMPPHERRMIHMALRNHPDVFTKSTGEGDARKVTIVPK